jgi:hypothetical protein
MATRSKVARRNRSKSSRRDKGAIQQESTVASPGIAKQILGVQRNLWNAGLSALSRGAKAGSSIGGTVITDSLHGGLKKLEDVFDERVMNSLTRAGMPSPAELSKLLERVEALSAEISRLKRRRSKV